MSSMQGQVQQAGLEAAAQVRGKEVPQDSPAVDKALDPNSDFPEKPLGSKEQQDATREYLGPASEHQGMKGVEEMKLVPPVAGRSGQGDLKGDVVEGVNRSVGNFVGSVGDTEGGKKGTGGVDFSNAAGMGGL